MRMIPLFRWVLIGWLFSVCLWSVCVGEEASIVRETADSLGTISIPYGFYNDSFGVAVGYVHSVTGYPQKQAGLLGTAMVGSQGSAMAILYGQDILLPNTERFLFDPIASVGYFSDNESYIDGNPSFTGERAGSNGSDKDNFVTGDGWDNYFRLRFQYLLPIAGGKVVSFDTVALKEGLPVSKPREDPKWNPLSSGKIYLELTPFYRSQQVDGDDIESKLKTNGLDVGVFWDNRDFHQNPSSGNALNIELSRDFGWLNSSESWTTVSAEYDHYIPLSLSSAFRQSVLAFDAWTAYSPSWNEIEDGEIENRPPAFSGATLGGEWRMRGYPSNRFSDKTAVYYAAELRMIPYWNPFDYWPWLQHYVGVEWVQIVPFVEVGRVAPSWDVSELHSDMKVDAGLGLRVWAKGIVARVDVAVSEEAVGVQMMVSQPFQF
ncbi:Surface antigen [Desulfoluna spongiiphila]|uniref:Surface antigen n=2 Tax=Desulfoluna spongiiphila TaxID=419481 RepID=A0A1G5F5X7_9BACT|nr:Surface antigen [Desulfoluna spongiiphila]VVS94283.1 bacterial surface antigen (d15) [Desulfoluna spongiiphila]